MRLLDTNIFIHHVTQPRTTEDRRRQAACETLFLHSREVGGTLATTEACFAEIGYVLMSKRLFALPGSQVAQMMRSLLDDWHIEIIHADVHASAADILAAHPVLGFEDALIAAYAIELKTDLMSYDRHFDRVDGIRRVEP